MPLPLADSGERGQAIHAGQPDVEHDEVDGAPRNAIEALLSRRDRFDGVPLVTEHAAQGATHAGFVVNDQDSRFHSSFQLPAVSFQLLRSNSVSSPNSERAAGSWEPEGCEWGDAGGRLYSTALALLTLEVYYRYANVFGENMGQAPLSDLELGAMQRELRQAAAPMTRSDLLAQEQNQRNQQNQEQNPNGNQPATPDANLAKPQPAPVDAPNNAPLPGGQLQSSLQANPLNGGLTTGESVRARVLTVPPAQQQTLANDTLQKRLEERFGKPAQNDVDAARQYNADLKKTQAKAGAAQPGAGQPGAAQGGQPAVGATVPPAAQGTMPPSVPGPTNVQGPRTAPPLQVVRGSTPELAPRMVIGTVTCTNSG